MGVHSNIKVDKAAIVKLRIYPSHTSLGGCSFSDCKSSYRLPNFVISFTEFTSQVYLRISDKRSHFEVDHLNHQAGCGHFDDLIHLHCAVGQLPANATPCHLTDSAPIEAVGMLEQI
jgi:hypothetical protein